MPGLDYDINSAALQKHRRAARKAGSAMALDRAQRIAYANAVETAVLAAQRSQLKRNGEPMPRPNCASGTWHSTGEAIGDAVRKQQHASLMAYAAKVRRARTPAQWQEMYDRAMAPKRYEQAVAKELAKAA